MRTALLRLAGWWVLAAALPAGADDPCPRPPPPPCPPTAPAPPVQPPPSPAPVSPKAELPGAAPAPAEKPADDEAAVRARSAAVRAALPAPTQPWTFERDLVFDGFLLGKVTVLAEPATLGEKPVWYVVERTVREAGEGRVVSESSCFLAQDLSVIRGETVLRAPGGIEAMSFGRRDGRMEVTAEEDGKTKSVDADVPADATIGLFPVIQFVEAAYAAEGAKAAKHHLPIFDPRHAFGDGEGKPLPAGLADYELDVAKDLLGVPIAVRATARSGRTSTLKIGGGQEQLFPFRVRSIEGGFPHWDVVPAAKDARKPDWFDRVGETPLTAYQAFCNFGRGYHLAKRELLESAFDWPSMHAHEIAAGTIKPDITLEKLKEDYIAEFLAMSKHRTAGDCDDLVTQILVTSTITKKPGEVSIAAIPVYGGHTFHIVEKDGRWWIARVD